jgi:hypothetical protein
MSEFRDRVKARMRFLHACDGINLSDDELELFADFAEARVARGKAGEDQSWERAKERALKEGRSAAEVFLEEAKVGNAAHRSET